MRPKKEIKPNKPRFVVDHNTSLVRLRTEYGGKATFVSSAALTGAQDTKDEDIIKIANEHNYHIITLNTKDFRDAPKKYDWLKVGIIGVNLKEKNYRTKFRRIIGDLKKHEHYYNKLIILGNEITIKLYDDLRKDMKPLPKAKTSK